MLGWLKRRTASREIRREGEMVLVETPDRDIFWLAEEGYIDKCIREKGVFEPHSTAVVRSLLKPGWVVLDVGANIGYYTVLMSRLVGASGRVIGFEPTVKFRQRLAQNLAANGLDNVDIFPYGLSDRNLRDEICFGESSATLHWVPDHPPRAQEEIELRRLDDLFPTLGLSRLDFIKVDIDGHEPAFLEGAWETIENYRPLVLLEVSHAHYLESGVTAWDFYQRLVDRGFHIYSEKGLRELRSKHDFLRECGNFTHSANILLAKDGELNPAAVHVS